MAFFHGRLATFTLNSVNLSAFMNTIDFDMSVDSHETTTYGKSAKTYISGLKDTTITIGGLDDEAASAVGATLTGLLGGAPVTFEYGPEGSTTGKAKYSGSCIVTSFTKSTPVGDVASWSADLQVTDVVTRGTYV